MKKIISTLIIFTSILVFSGCSGKVIHMNLAPYDKKIEAPKKGKVIIVFFRPSNMGHAIQSSVFEMSNSGAKILGIVASGKKISYELDPGKHLFMIVGESADFMSAILEPNKTYYAMIKPRPGFFKARFSLQPISAKEFKSKKITSYLNKTQLVEISEDTIEWSQKHKNNILAKYNKYHKSWMKKKAKDRHKLVAEDGI